MQNDKLLPCPFCDKKLKRFKGGYEHKSSQCVLSSFILTDVEVPKWNTRKPMERIVEQLEARHKFYEDRFAEMSGTDRDVEDWGSIKSYADAIDIVKGGVDNAG